MRQKRFPRISRIARSLTVAARYPALVLLALWLCPLALLAQTDRGLLTGSVADAGGAAMPASTIVATHTDTHRPGRVLAIREMATR